MMTPEAWTFWKKTDFAIRFTEAVLDALSLFAHQNSDHGSILDSALPTCTIFNFSPLDVSVRPRKNPAKAFTMVKLTYRSFCLQHFASQQDRLGKVSTDWMDVMIGYFCKLWEWMAALTTTSIKDKLIQLQLPSCVPYAGVQIWSDHLG